MPTTILCLSHVVFISAAWSSYCGDSKESGLSGTADGGHVIEGLTWAADGGHVIIPDGTISIPGYAFYGCSRIIVVTIPSSVSDEGDWDSV
jgi:hypothetical protein